MPKILFLEDDRVLAESVVDFLEEEGYDVTHVSDGDAAIDASFDNSYDLYLFDVNVPNMNGFELLKALREADDTTPTFFLTALSDIDSLKEGFLVGADDYIKKPFDMDELLIRIESKIAIQSTKIVYKHISYDPKNHEIKINDKRITLGEVQQRIADLLLRHIGQTVDKVQFLDVMDQPSDQALRVHITKLKQLLDMDIINVRGVGYRIEL